MTKTPHLPLPPILVGIFIMSIIIVFSGVSSLSVVRLSPNDNTHIHADFKLVINNQEVDFSGPEYDGKNRYAHLHNDNFDSGQVIHFHARGLSIGFFLDTLDIGLTSRCLHFEGESYCTTPVKKLRFFVNDEERFDFGQYTPKNNDRILILYGRYAEQDIQEWLENVTDYSCIFSRNCPEGYIEEKHQEPFELYRN